jgi:O-antigen/teichoic acid export membrane protein
MIDFNKIYEFFRKIFRKKDIFYYVLSLIFARVVGLVIPKIIISLNGEVNYGKFILCFGLFTMIINLFSSGITNCIVKYALDKDSFNKLYIGIRKILGLFIFVVSLIFFIISFFIERFFPVYQIDEFPLALGSFYIFFSLLNAFFIGVHFVRKAYSKMMFSNFIGYFILVLTMLLLPNILKISGALFSYILFSALTTFMLYQAPSKAAISKIKTELVPTKIFSEFLIPSFLSASLVPIAIWSSNLIVLDYLGFMELGLVSIFLQVQLVYNFLPGILNSIWLPKLNQLYQTDRQGYFHSLKTLFYYSAGISLAIFLFFIIFSAPILATFSPRYLPFLNVFYLFNASFLVSNIIATAGQHIMSSDQMWWGFGLNIIWGVVLILSTIVFVPQSNLLGYGFAFLSAYFVHFIFVTLFVIQIKKKLFNNVA